MKKVVFHNRSTVTLAVILILALFLRFYKMEETFLFGVETGGDLLSIKEALTNNSLPLHGSVTSHPWLFFGPYHLWLLAPVMLLTHFNPLSYALFARTISFITVILVYKVTSAMFTQRIGAFAAFLFALSPFHMYATQLGRHDSFTIILSIIVLYLFYKFYTHKKVNTVLLGIASGVLIVNEYNSLILLPGLFFIYIKEGVKPLTLQSLFKISTFQQSAKYLLGFFISFLPLIIFDLLNSQKMFLTFMLWIPYRIIRFATSFTMHEYYYDIPYTVNNFKSFFSQSIVPQNSFLNLAIAVGAFIYVVFLSIDAFKHYSSKNIQIMIIIFVLALLSLIVYSNPPIHYFNAALYSLIVIWSFLLNRLWQIPRYGRYVVLFLLTVILVINFKYYFSEEWFFKNRRGTYALQKSVAQKIILDANGEKFELARIGLFDEQMNQFADNYIFLLWYLGNKPVRGASLRYTIIENEQGFSSSNAKELKGDLLLLGGVKILKQRID